MRKCITTVRVCKIKVEVCKCKMPYDSEGMKEKKGKRKKITFRNRGLREQESDLQHCFLRKLKVRLRKL